MVHEVMICPRPALSKHPPACIWGQALARSWLTIHLSRVFLSAYLMLREGLEVCEAVERTHTHTSGNDSDEAGLFPEVHAWQ